MISVLIVVPRMIYPAVSGGEVRVSSLMRALAGRARFTVLSFLESGRELDQAVAALEMERAWGVASVFVRRGKPSAAADAPELARPFIDDEMTAAIERTARDCSAEVIQLEFTQMAHYAQAAARVAPVVLTEHDSSVLSPRGSYVRAAGEDEALRTEKYLRRAFDACARVVTVSEADARRLARLSPRDIFRVVPTGVDLERFAFRPLEGREAGRVAFVGHYPHFPNEDAAVFLCEDVLPRLRRLRPGAKAALVGSAPTEAVRALAGREGVELVGGVPDVAPELQRARVFIAPMRLGFGIKGKILEAFACGTPVVATPQSCEAMPGARDGEHALLASDADGLAAAAARLLSDDALARKLGEAGRAYVAARFGWSRQADLMEQVYREAMNFDRKDA